MEAKAESDDEKIASVTLATLSSYRKIAEQPNRRNLLLKDKGCLSFLVYVLDDKCNEIVVESLEILLLLTECNEHCQTVRNCAAELQEMLPKIRSFENGPSQSRIGFLSNELSNRLINASSFIKPAAFKTPLVPPQQKRRVRPTGRLLARPAGVKAKTITFKLPACFNAHSREIFERAILGLKGVISVYFNSQNGQVQIRAKTDVEELDVAELLINSCVECDEVVDSIYQVVKDSAGTEHLVLFEARHDATLNNTLASRTHVEPPEYLSESFGEHSPERGGLPLARTDSGNNLARGSNSNKGGWFNNISSFLTQSFYW